MLAHVSINKKLYLVILAERLLRASRVLLLHVLDRIDGEFESLATDVALIAVSGSVDAPLVLAGVPKNRRRDSILCLVCFPDYLHPLKILSGWGSTAV